MTVRMGCIIVTFNSERHITACLKSLAEATNVQLKVVIVDNASSDATTRQINSWAAGQSLDLTLIQAADNRGFAAGVNIGLTHIMADKTLDRVWILNPDCTVPPETPALLATAPLPFALLGSRIVYANNSGQIQIDGGQVNRWTGATRNLNIGRDPSRTQLPAAAYLDFISGASMVASRDFIAQAGPMPEQYFLYYEEVHWAQQRDQLPLTICPGATIYHHAGASIGSPTLQRGPSRLSAYHKHRARMLFMASFHPMRLPVAYAFGWAKLIQHIVRRQFEPIPAILRALHGLSSGT
ncbi:glycosyltransferase family 2 protein [Litoreibacter albidus]|uniref:Glycosyltransferase 2-like domain-containing protein n=1 Tax=Litoreibacter albidus TaxID=670155 RepID=A0A1H2W5K2_9RHOB|nr:glycosyltransferase family 2 protein [Litoreibacter albidus]SDW75942.1 hypothetical protein SAMN04488001_1729 [Litoreibacter albidus]